MAIGFDIDVPEQNIHALVTIIGDEGIREVLDQVMKREKHKYLPLGLETKARLESDQVVAGCYVRVGDNNGNGQKSISQYGFGFYKDGKFLGHLPFEREFLGLSWNMRHIEGHPFIRAAQMVGAAAQPRFIPDDGYRYGSYIKGPTLEFRVKQTEAVEAPYKIDLDIGCN